MVLGDGTIIEAVAFKILKSRKYPQGIKYSFQHYDPITGKTILRYDNYSQHSGTRHHKHIGESETRPTEFESLKTHFKNFIKGVNPHGEKNT
ncbi:hypothetical protein AKJ52_00595 [candidate division MSBL1 archaeon SCGC-AAA382C18]|uniref:Uncharacterized protein n=1 Tax=candidate division MSBL1 archaeon SCGC-AAA382C18 TaxID=1698281 RepID=A0A133VLF0_9EURY|nr:hypothetical protein AKJ52_00595 [candidate division MSBL1 archaeon SCGC-AAA382C18]